jgi:hypothetical protein
MKLLTFLLLIGLTACHHYKIIETPKPSVTALNGTAFYKSVFALNWKERDSLATDEIINGNIPHFFKKFVPVSIQAIDTTGNILRAVIYVSQDYLAIGNDHDFARIPLTPMTAQKIADHFQCFLPTRKLVNDIYKAAKIKLEPIPMYAFRDSAPTFYQHHLMIEGQRQGRKGLIAGIKKDIVISGKLWRDPKMNRVAIYGWHQSNGKPIQPLYTGHVDWYVDYSHGVRLVYRKIKVDNKWMDYEDVFKHPILKKLICDEEYCDFYKYPY